MENICACLMMAILMTACHDSISVFKGCCQDPPVYKRVGDGEIYIPNVFTPNDDGINDRLIIYGDSIVQILRMEIWNKDGVRVKYALHFPPNDPNVGWDGKVNGRVERGLYSFELSAETYNGYAFVVKGNVCNCPCDQMIDADLIPIQNCKFGINNPTDPDNYPHEFLPCFAQ